MTGANSGTFRLYCAEHILQEVFEHSERWAFECHVAHDAFLECWERQFLPIFRLVRTRSLRKLLSPKERQRIDQLADQDDAPSAMLALTIGAFFLTEDRDARLAVYGVYANPEERRRWLAPLMSGGDAGELWKFILTATAIPTLAMSGIWKLGRWLNERSPWTLGAAFASATFLAARISRENYRRIGSVLWHLSTHFVDGVIVPYNQSVERFNAMAPLIRHGRIW
jgi:predicted nucleic acid-binding protein